MLGGAVIVADHLHRGQALAEAVGYQQFAGGAVSGPQDSYLAARGLKTLGLRMERHCATASTLARWLDDRPEVARVYYPGLESHPGHELAKRQQRGFGGVMAIRLRGDKAAAWRFIDATRFCSITANLGDVKTTIVHPATTTHGRISEQEKRDAGITDNLIRVAVGLEDIEDLKADTARGLAAL